MSEKRIDPLALYAGLDITHPVAGLRVPTTYRAIAHVFKKAENALNLLQFKNPGKIDHSNLESNDQLSKRGRHS